MGYELVLSVAGALDCCETPKWRAETQSHQFLPACPLMVWRRLKTWRSTESEGQRLEDPKESASASVFNISMEVVVGYRDRAQLSQCISLS